LQPAAYENPVQALSSCNIKSKVIRDVDIIIFTYIVAIYVFQPYLIKFLIEPGYEKPIKSLEQILQSDMKDGSFEQ